MIKVTPLEVMICDEHNRKICSHHRAYSKWPKYMTVDEHMKPQHIYYKEVNSKDGDYYRRRASVFGPNMSQFIDILLRSQTHEEQAYNSCSGILHACKSAPHHIVKEVAKKCIETKSVFYSAFKKRFATAMGNTRQGQESLPVHSNIRGENVYVEKIGGMK